jgi:hypothetical protein
MPDKIYGGIQEIAKNLTVKQNLINFNVVSVLFSL